LSHDRCCDLDRWAYRLWCLFVFGILGAIVSNWTVFPNYGMSVGVWGFIVGAIMFRGHRVYLPAPPFYRHTKPFELRLQAAAAGTGSAVSFLSQLIADGAVGFSPWRPLEKKV
jgi:hypothetical protein